MPEMYFRIRWPDGGIDQCYSPSSVISRHLTASQTYDIADFMQRSRRALTEASARVEHIYGMPCSRAQAQLAALETKQARFAPADVVTCLDLTSSATTKGHSL